MSHASLCCTAYKGGLIHMATIQVRKKHCLDFLSVFRMDEFSTILKSPFLKTFKMARINIINSEEEEFTKTNHITVTTARCTKSCPQSSFFIQVGFRQSFSNILSVGSLFLLHHILTS